MRSTYDTHGRTEILECLGASPQTHFTASELHSRLKDLGAAVSLATVYRQLDKLVSEGLVVRFTPEGEKSACFQLLDTSECCKDHCYHLKCEQCGKLIHINCHEVTRLEEHMLSEHGFAVDAGRTVFYGLCSDCYRKANSV